VSVWEQYVCGLCGGYGDQCMCGPAAYGCTFDELCTASWHIHDCPAETGTCDRPEQHLPGWTAWQYPPPPVPLAALARPSFHHWAA
jgi:hypothetical protein